jgi:1,2-diacylglycerol 3-alpha-glucosyltransferase
VFTFGDEKKPLEEDRVILSPGVPIKGVEFHFNLMYNRRARNLTRTMDVLHVHHPFISGSIALRIAEPKNIPVIFTNHTRYDLYAQIYLPNFIGSVGESIVNSYLPNFYRRVNLVLAPSVGIKNLVREICGDCNLEIEPHGMDLEPFRRYVTPIDRSQFGFSSQDVVMINVGRFGPEKNLPFLLRAFYGANKAYPNTKLILVGDGPEKDNLVDRVQHMGLREHVRFAGQIPFDEIPAYYKMADLFVTASVTETFGFTIVEAMASGLPVLGIDSPGVSDNIEPGITGVISSEDLADFTAQMVRIISETELRKQLGLNAVRFSEKYDIRKAVTRLEGIYQHTVDEAGSRS